VSLSDESYLRIARAIAEDAKCTRRKVGAIIVDDEGHIVATGRNGAPPGRPECTDGACPRGLHYEVIDQAGSDLQGSWKVSHCGGCGAMWPCEDSVDPGSSYDTGPGSCIALHAEQNALLNRTVPSVKGMTMFVTDTPCDGCKKLILGARLARVKAPAYEYTLVL